MNTRKANEDSEQKERKKNTWRGQREFKGESYIVIF